MPSTKPVKILNKDMIDKLNECILIDQKLFISSSKIQPVEDRTNIVIPSTFSSAVFFHL